MADETVAKLLTYIFDDDYRKADRYLLAAMIYNPRFLAPYANFATIPAQKRICHSNRMKAFGCFGNSHNPVPLSQHEFTSIDALYFTLGNVLTPNTVGRLPTALRYYQQAFRADIDWSVRFLGMMMAMEALLSHGTSEVSHQVSERAAFLLGKDAVDRELLYDTMRSLYSLRSAIAHGRTMKKNAELGSSFENLMRIFQRFLVKTLSEPTLLSLFLSASDTKFTEAMKRLVFLGSVG
jgi:hypothetical protein